MFSQSLQFLYLQSPSNSYRIVPPPRLLLSRYRDVLIDWKYESFGGGVRKQKEILFVRSYLDWLYWVLDLLRLTKSNIHNGLKIS